MNYKCINNNNIMQTVYIFINKQIKWKFRNHKSKFINENFYSKTTIYHNFSMIILNKFKDKMKNKIKVIMLIIKIIMSTSIEHK